MLKYLLIALVTALTSGFSANAMAFGGLFDVVDDAVAKVWVCPYPEEAILNTIDCIECENAVCASAGYAPNFVMYHNGEQTDVEMSAVWWVGAFFVLDFQLDIHYMEQIDDDQVLIEYVETVTTNQGDVFLQHETAYVTLNSACQIEVWDQYGDDAEQQAVADAVAELVPSSVDPI